MNNVNLIKQLNGFFEYFQEELILTNKSNYTIKSYKNTINGFIQFLRDSDKEISLSSLTKLDLINFLNYKNLHLQKQQEMSVRSKKLYLIHLKTFFKYINDLGSYSLDIEKIFNLNIKIPSTEPKGLKNQDVEKIVKELNYFIKNQLEYIAIAKSGNRINGVQIYKIVATFFKKIHINYTGVHTLRHTFAKDMIAKDVNITIVQKLLEHESISTTMIYTNPGEREIQNSYLMAQL